MGMLCDKSESLTLGHKLSRIKQSASAVAIVFRIENARRVTPARILMRPTEKNYRTSDDTKHTQSVFI